MLGGYWHKYTEPKSCKFCSKIASIKETTVAPLPNTNILKHTNIHTFISGYERIHCHIECDKSS